MNEKVKDILTRALKTFWQTALASVIFAMPQIIESFDGGWSALKPILISTGIGALAAGFSAMYNGVLKPLAEKLNPKAKPEIEAAAEAETVTETETEEEAEEDTEEETAQNTSDAV